MDVYKQSKVVLVTRRTRLEDLLVRHHSWAQARFYIEHLGGDFRDYEAEHESYCAAKAHAVAALSRFSRHQLVDRQFLPNFLFAPDDIVVALGQDGLVANTLKYLDGQPLIGVNPEPARFDGILLPFLPPDLAKVLDDVAHGRRSMKSVTMARVDLSDRQTLYAVNDFFLGAGSHVSARYEINSGGNRERHSSSGVIVATGLGSTAWVKSILCGAESLARLMKPVGSKPFQDASRYQPLPWDEAALRFVVREPFPSVETQTNLIYGRVDKRTPLRIRSLMPTNGVIFSDGIEADYLQFNAGTEAVFSVADRAGTLVQ